MIKFYFIRIESNYFDNKKKLTCFSTRYCIYAYRQKEYASIFVTLKNQILIRFSFYFIDNLILTYSFKKNSTLII